MKYLVINPYHNASHGIANYIKNLKSIVNDIDLISFDNKKNLSPIEFREEVLKYVTTKFGYDDVIIEAPEAKASTLLLPAKYNVHIRLHCPLAVAQKYDGQTPNQQEYSNELRVINKAKLVSSPSYALVKEIGNELKSTQVTYYKNPIDIGDSEKNVDKQYDLVFMGRFQELKGTSHINKILENLPENYNVLLFGAKSETLKISPKVKCKVYKKGQVLGNARFDLIRKSKCLMMPSNFENCSMVILESLACHVPVVTWDVGGNKEIAPPSIIKCAKLGDYNDYSRKIVSFIENPPSSNDFTSAIDCINKDFSTGITHLINEIAQKTIIPYLGMNNEKLHIYEPTRNDQTITEINKLRVFGIAYSNEHIEELWGPVISYLGYEYRYVSRQPLGHHTVFKHEPFQIEKKWFCHFDWNQRSSPINQPD
ncbi:glycosyltransferase [Rahnella inusitata]|uniref:glycosyltransferase n=1 Tax=Rahnella inusitata TaxID=58169 RepID=UPI0039BE558B